MADDAGKQPARWCPTAGAVIGALVVLVSAPVAIAGDTRRAVPAVLLSVVLTFPLVGRWPLSRFHVVCAAALWLVVGAFMAFVGFGLVAFAAIPALIGALVGWGTRPSQPSE